MPFTPSFDESCSAQSGAQKRSGSGRKWLSLLGVVPLCLALLACQPSEVLAYKKGDGHSYSESDRKDRGVEQARQALSKRSRKDSQAPSEQQRQAANAVPLVALPPVAQGVYRLIHQGGPFPYEKDGSIFANRERLLPVQKRGFYREYTVAPPRARSRGARRIVCGGPRQQPEVCYYTADHYASFQQIIP